MYSGYTQTNLSQSGRLEMVLRKYLQATLFTKISLKTVILFGPLEKRMQEKYPFNDWIVGIKP